MPLSSRTSLGHYEVHSLLGAGGMGEVYLAHDTQLKRKVALKVLPANLINNRERLRRFKQEARAASALNHPNIITIHEIGISGDTHFIATEFIDGESLRQRMRREGVKLGEALEISVQAASALTAAHETGIIHRDIKPENIMLRRDGYGKVLDFGLAKLTEKSPAHQSSDSDAPTLLQTDPGTVMGTVAYMSPEQARGKEVDARTDIFSLGVVLYEMATRKLPFKGETTSDLIAAILKSEPVLPSSFNREIPAELERIILKSLAKDREERYQTARDLLIDLKALKQDLEFRNKLERTAPPNREEAKTQIFGATTAGGPHTTSSAEYVVSGIKNHKRSLAIILSVLVLAAAGFGYWFYANRTANTKQIESIAVLPFQNGSGNAENEYLSDGMAESLISSLSQIPKLNVKARSSVFRYKGKETDLKKIAQELKVQAILSGHVVQRGEQLILNLELVDAVTENILWAEQYNRKQTDLVALQNEIARDVTNKLRVKLSGADEQKLSKSYTENAEAYQLYLKGRYERAKFTPEGLRKSIEYYNQAVGVDQTYALAYVGLSGSYQSLGSLKVIPHEEALLKARFAAERALALDDSLAEAHLVMGGVRYFLEWNWESAAVEFKRAIEINPNEAEAHMLFSFYLASVGKVDESLQTIRRARELDPLSSIINGHVGSRLYFARRYDEAVEELKKAAEMNTNLPVQRYPLGNIYERQGRYAEALAEYQKMPADAPNHLGATGWVAHLYAVSGRPAEARVALERLREMGKSGHVSNYLIALTHAGLGEKDEAFAYLEKAREGREYMMLWVKVEPQLDGLRSDPRFQDLLRRVGLMP
ncbi:MAG TPA: FlgO family outer membrane protein [Pyrinomonadaceae bacterium]|nr:FlgO family outer membrane protein [Pyrinomonadaceae bacterium]